MADATGQVGILKIPIPTSPIAPLCQHLGAGWHITPAFCPSSCRLTKHQSAIFRGTVSVGVTLNCHTAVRGSSIREAARAKSRYRRGSLAGVRLVDARRDIDGLRAVAVLPVVLFHAKVPGFSGGFVGVDVFFVISGYLITGLIAEDWKAGRFSFVTFYFRRVKRILPALLCVYLACTLLAADAHAAKRHGRVRRAAS